MSKSEVKKDSGQVLKTIGIIGGGQLGRMICFDAHKMGFRTLVFSDQKNSPASFVTNQVITASYTDKSALKKFSTLADIATFEFENIPLETANFVAAKVALYPSPQVLKVTQHRILEKDFLNITGIKTAEYAKISSLEDLQKNLQNFRKAILKTATLGYDGKGQFVLENSAAADKLWPHVKNQELILEKFCPFDCEISVIAARSTSGEIITYEPLVNIHKNGILNQSIYPAKISEELKIKAQKIAKKIVEKLDLIGILAVEFFVIQNELLVNELAPRPHNSGHFSMDAAFTSQFEQLIRAITGMKLGNAEFHSQGYMQNLIGNQVQDLKKFQQNPYAKIHLYGKKRIIEGRKMGHINILEVVK